MFSGTVISTLLGLGVGGVGIGLGGLAACCLGTKCRNYLGFILATAAGMIFSLLAFELLPESVEAGGITPTLLGIIIGLVIIMYIERLFHRVVIITGNPQHSLLIRSGILLAVGIAIHNLPIGFAMGAGLANQPKVGLDLATTMIFHNFPEGLALALPLILADLNRIFIFVISSIVALPAGLGSFLGSALGEINPSVLAVFFGIAIGTILFVTWHEILSHARKQLIWTLLVPFLALGILLGKLFTLFLIH
ncbi:MAG: ZIP family metal transporter [Clostridia bacterium]|nr:ZIP family metal transporter [Clostridia bacterium]